MTADREQVVALLGAMPGAERLLEALADRHDVHLVGGPVRDLLLGLEPQDIDLVVEGDAVTVARIVAERLGGELRVHERFGTATVAAGELVFDLASARSELYPRPGALPDVAPASLWDDLHRRDFTINSAALALAAPERGTITALPQTRDDLDAGVLRVLHDGSFRDDPTRLVRLARYAARFGFAIDPHTEQLARDAVEGGALRTVSGPRIGHELLRLLADDRAIDALAILAELGVLRALGPGLALDRTLAERLPGGELRSARPLALLACCARASDGDELGAWLDSLGLTAGARDAVLAAAHETGELVTRLRAAQAPSRIARLLRGRPPEVLAVAAALSAEEPVRRWLDELRAIQPDIGGEDLLGAGMAESPALGRALQAAWDAKLDGRAPGRDEQLEVALRVASEQ